MSLVDQLDIKKHRTIVYILVFLIAIFSIFLGIIEIVAALLRNDTLHLFVAMSWTLISIYLMLGWAQQKRRKYLPFMIVNTLIGCVLYPASIFMTIYGIFNCNYGFSNGYCYNENCNILIFGLTGVVSSIIHFVLDSLIWIEFDFIGRSNSRTPTSVVNTSPNYAGTLPNI